MADESPAPPLPPLYHACMANDVALVRQLLEGGADPNDGESVYHSAQLNRAECLELLLAHGADLSGRNATYRNTPLYFLAGYREQDGGAKVAVEGMRWLLEHGADPNVTSYDTDETPLHAIARNGWPPPVAKLLVQHGADVNGKRADGRTAYVLTLRTGNAPLAEYLRAQGADTAGLMPIDLLLAACMRDDETEARAVLAGNPGLTTALTADDRATIVQAVYERREASLRLMAKLGFNLGAEGGWGGTPLHHAAWLGNAPLVKLLLEFHAPVNVRDSEFGSSPLGWAAHGSVHHADQGGDYPAVVVALLDAGANRAASINKWGEPPEGMASPRSQRC